jgi:sugar phosphate isomerase/epimerase
MKLAVQCYTIREDLAKDLWGTLQKVRDMGFRNVEITGSYGLPAAEFKSGLDKLGLSITSNHVGYDALAGDFAKVVEENKAFENRVLILPWISQEHYASGWDAFAHEVEGLGRKAKDAGMKLCYHNHAFEFENKQDGKYGLDVFYETADPSLVYAQIDTYWVAYGGADPAEYIRKLKGRVLQVHFKDGPLGQGKPSYVPVGQGDLDWDDILAACHEAGVEAGAIELDESPGEPLDAVRESAEFLVEKGLKL